MRCVYFVASANHSIPAFTPTSSGMLLGTPMNAGSSLLTPSISGVGGVAPTPGSTTTHSSSAAAAASGPGSLLSPSTVMLLGATPTASASGLLTTPTNSNAMDLSLLPPLPPLLPTPQNILPPPQPPTPQPLSQLPPLSTASAVAIAASLSQLAHAAHGGVPFPPPARSVSNAAAKKAAAARDDDYDGDGGGGSDDNEDRRAWTHGMSTLSVCTAPPARLEIDTTPFVDCLLTGRGGFESD